MRCLLLLGLCGCELYFTDGPAKMTPIDAGKPMPADASICPSDPPPPNLTGEILSPADGATNVASPVDIVYRWSTTNQDARKGALFYNANGSYTSDPVPCPAPAEGWCFALKPNTKYTFQLFWVCYADGTHPVYDQITFTSAP